MPYPYAVQIPEIVARAHAQAQKLGFPLMPEGRPIGTAVPTTATTPSDGALLRSLAASRATGRIGEIGTGPGVSTAWIISGMSKSGRLLTCDIDRSLAAAARDFFRDYPNVEVRCGDWQSEIGRDPRFDLLFFDANGQDVLAQRQNWDRVVDMLVVGGLIMFDDLAPVEYWPQEWKGMTDHKREFCLSNPRLAGAEVRTSERTACLVATRLT